MTIMPQKPKKFTEIPLKPKKLPKWPRNLKNYWNTLRTKKWPLCPQNLNNYWNILETLKMTEGSLKYKNDQNTSWNLYLQDQNDNTNFIQPLYLLDLKLVDFKINGFKNLNLKSIDF